MRKKPDVTPPENLTHRTLEQVVQKRKYELITPLYGGGVATNDNDPTMTNRADPITVVRATEVRGQLRFWWRALRGAQSEGDPSLKKREDAIWGKAYEKGDKGMSPDQTVQIVADLIQEGKPIKPFYIERNRPKPDNGIPGYAAFPLQPDQDKRRREEPPIPDVRKGVQFLLTISYPVRLREDIEAALWAWETFGGLGARTRRGFGALHLLEIDGIASEALPTSRDAERWIRDGMRKHLKEGNFPRNLPHFSNDMQFVVTPSVNTPTQSWNALIRKLQDFRLQKDEHNRSAWPEADAIRKIAGKSTKNVPATPQTFPRAAFGLPIIFHFTGDDVPENHTLNEADTQTGEGEHEKLKHKERFASPLILRPFLCRDNRAVGLALLLEGSRVDLPDLVLQDEQKMQHPVTGMLTSKEARSLTKRLPGLQNETDVLQAFMKFCKGVK